MYPRPFPDTRGQEEAVEESNACPSGRPIGVHAPEMPNMSLGVKHGACSSSAWSMGQHSASSAACVCAARPNGATRDKTSLCNFKALTAPSPGGGSYHQPSKEAFREHESWVIQSKPQMKASHEYHSAIPQMKATTIG